MANSQRWACPTRNRLTTMFRYNSESTGRLSFLLGLVCFWNGAQMEQIAPQNVCNDENNSLIKLNQHHPIHPFYLHFSQDAVGMIELMTSSTISNATPSSMYLLIPGEIEFRTMHADESVRKRNHFKNSVLRASRHYYQMLMNWVMQQELKAKWFWLLT